MTPRKPTADKREANRAIAYLESEARTMTFAANLRQLHAKEFYGLELPIVDWNKLSEPVREAWFRMAYHAEHWQLEHPIKRRIVREEAKRGKGKR